MEGVPLTLPAGEIAVFHAPVLSPDVLSSLDRGVTKELVILHMPWGGNTLHVFDGNLAPILDAFAYHHATRIIFTNQDRVPNEPLRGHIVYKSSVTMFGHPMARNRLKIQSHEGKEYLFRDEYSFWAWQARALKPSVARVYFH